MSVAALSWVYLEDNKKEIINLRKAILFFYIYIFYPKILALPSNFSSICARCQLSTNLYISITISICYSTKSYKYK